jgi:hypothetical protein
VIATTAQCLNTFGLILGMLRAVLIFIWGPPQSNFDEGVGADCALKNTS